MSEPQNADRPIDPSASASRDAAPDRQGVAGWKIVTFVIGGGVLVAGVTLGYHMYQSGRVIGFFGREAVQTIQRADRATVYVPADAEYSGPDAIEQGGLRWRPFAPGENGEPPRNETEGRGWVHIHPAFLAAESYFWDEFPPVDSLEPDAFVRFARADGSTADVFLDWEAASLYVAGQDRGLRMTEQKRDALREYLLRAEEYEESPFGATRKRRDSPEVIAASVDLAAGIAPTALRE
jgi:hypothetical protein